MGRREVEQDRPHETAQDPLPAIRGPGRPPHNGRVAGSWTVPSVLGCPRCTRGPHASSQRQIMSSQSPIAEFPFRTRLSLAHLVDFWEQQAEDTSSLHAPLARVIVERLEGAPELRQIVDEPSALEPRR